MGLEAYMQENNIRSCFMCKTRVARVEGCIHRTCPICDYEWCWLCGREYSCSTHLDNECCKHWNPIAPEIILKEERKVILTPKMIQKKLLRLFLEQIFWPIFVMDIFELVQNESKSLKTKIVRGALAINLDVFYIWGLVFQIENIWLFLALLTVPWVLKGFEQLTALIEQGDKRWMLRNKSLFHYTTNSQPNNAHNEEPRIVDDMRNYMEEQEEEDLGAYIY